MLEIYPVIHVSDSKTTQNNAKIAYDTGCDGVIFIDMGGADYTALDEATTAKKTYEFDSSFWIGINLLEHDPSLASSVALRTGLNICWSDYKPSKEDLKFLREDMFLREDYEFFASFDFKYQNRDSNVLDTLDGYVQNGLIPITSGAQTGVPPDLDKIKYYRNHLGDDYSLGIASGLSPDNIASYAPYISHALVCTGISDDFYTFNEDKLRKFVENSKFNLLGIG